MRMPEFPGQLLVVSTSARHLVRSAARAGLRPVALDLYADADTRDLAECCEAVPPSGHGLDGAALLAAAARWAPGYPLVYGSGLDGAFEALAELVKGRELYGNSPESVRWLKTPARFFPLLSEFRIPYPETRFSPPDDPENWLIKAGCGQGGKGVRFCAQDRAGPDDYFQRRLAGPPLSALFLADGHRAQIVGYNTLWTASRFGRPFLFGGAINRAELDQDQRQQVQAHVATLTRTVGLRGLNSIDFMLDGRTCSVLEINPRPSATLALYDADFPDGILAAHLRACRGRLDDTGCAGRVVRAFAPVFADRVIRVGTTTVWPRWCADRPLPGTIIAAGEPFCTVEAEGCASMEVVALIRRRQARALELPGSGGG